MTSIFFVFNDLVGLCLGAGVGFVSVCGVVSA